MPAFAELADLFTRGGPVMWPLLALSVLSLTFSIERTAFWAKLHAPGRRRRNERLIRSLGRHDRHAVEAATTRDHSLYADAARELARRPPDPDAAGAASIELVERHRPAFERFAAAMATITAAAPLLGILGTVLGIIDAFDLLGQGRVDDVAAVAAGIAQALLTTAFGLIVALVTLFPAMLFRAQADRCLSTLERLVAAAAQRRSTNNERTGADRPTTDQPDSQR